jgi:hypothetical protein
MSGRCHDILDIVRAPRAGREPHGFGAVIRGRRTLAAELIRRIVHDTRFSPGRPV